MTISSAAPIQCVLFDLDGTLIDTAPDMVNTLNYLLSEEGLPPLPYQYCRKFVSHGSAAMIEIGFGKLQSSQDVARRRSRFIDIYAENLCVDTKLFNGMESVLDYLEKSDICWGVVTNKPGFLTLPLMEMMSLRHRACSIVAGDTLSQRKPDPEPMWLATEQCGVSPQHTLYVGDAERDIQAGRNANMYTLLATYGYISDDDDVLSWGAHGKIDQADEIVGLLQGNL